MPVLSPNSALSEYLFSDPELKQAKLLNPLQIMWFQTKYAMLFKEKAASLIPEDESMDRSFFLKQGNIQGKLDMLQEIFEDCTEARKQLDNPQKPENGQEIKESLVAIQDIATRASAQVHEMPEF